MAAHPLSLEGPEEDLVKLYLGEIGRNPLLTKEDEARLGALMETGADARARLAGGGRLSRGERARLRAAVRAGEEAAETFVECNLRLVVSVAKKYQWSGLPLLDLVQEGNLGLIHAVEKFDYRKGFKFSTYATWWIRQSISRGIANSSRTIRLPVHVGDRVDALRRASTHVESMLGRAGTPEELAEELGWTVDEVVAVGGLPGEPMSLDAPLSEDSDESLGYLIADGSAIDPGDEAVTGLLPRELDRVLSVLEPQEQAVLRLHYGLETGETRTFAEVGAILGLTGERVRQIEKRAMARLRHASTAEQVRDLLAA